MNAAWLAILLFTTACGNTPQPAPPPVPSVTPELAKKPAPIPQPTPQPQDVPAVAKVETPPPPPPCPKNEVREADGVCRTPRLSAVSCERRQMILADDGRSCRKKRFTDYCNASESLSDEEELTVSRIVNGLHLSDCIEVERYLTRQPILILPADGQKISDLRPLATLTMLRALHVPNNRIVDIAPLAELTNLEILNLRHNAISDVAPLAGLTKLRRLDLVGNDVRDLTALTRTPRLMQIQVDPAQKRERMTMREISAGTLQ